MFQHFKLLAGKGSLKPIWESNEELLPCDCRRARHHSNRTSRMHEGIARATHFDERNDLRAGEDVVGLVRHGRNGSQSSREIPVLLYLPSGLRPSVSIREIRV